MQRPQTNPDARDPEDVLGTSLPDTISACSWKRPCTYLVIRTDDGRLSTLDDHDQGRILRKFHTRHNAAGSQALFRRRGEGSYTIVAEPNDAYEET